MKHDKILTSLLIVTLFACLANVAYLWAQPPAVPANTLNDLGLNEPYFISVGGYSVGADEVISALRAATFTTLNTGQGDYELYAMNQDLETTDAAIFTTIDTGQGANEVFDMDQNVDSTASVVFNDVNVTDELMIDSEAITNWDDLSSYITLGDEGTGFSLGAYTHLLRINDTYVGDPGVQDYLVYNQTSDLVFSDTNYTAAITYAVESVSALGGGYVYHTEGIYYVYDPVWFTNIYNVVIGGSHGAEIRLVSTQYEVWCSYGYQFNTPNANVTIEDLFWNCSDVTDSIDGSIIEYVGLNDHMTVQNCIFLDGVTWTHIFGDINAGHVNVKDNTFINCKSSTGVVHPHSGGDWTIIGNYFDGGGGEAIRHGRLVVGNIIMDFVGGGLVGYTDARIVTGGDPYLCEGNIISGGGGDGISLFSKGDVIGNIIQDCATGIAIVSTGLENDAEHCNLLDNEIWDCSEYGIHIDDQDDVSIQGGMIERTVYDGIWIEDSDDCSIKSVQIGLIGLAQDGVQDGIYLDNSDRTHISGVRIQYDSTWKTDWIRYGVYVENSHNCSVLNCEVKDAVRGIDVKGSLSTAIIGNVLLTHPEATHSIYLSDGSNFTASFTNYCHDVAEVNGAACTNNSFTSCIFPGDITNTGTGTRAWENFNPWTGVFITDINAP